MTHIARGTFTVELKALAFENALSEPLLGRRSIDKQIEGDLTATTRGQMLSVGTAMQGSAAYVAIEIVAGTLHGKRGRFALQHTGIMNRGVPQLTITVVPDSGTDELIGLRGSFVIDIRNGEHRYEFTYELAPE